MQGVVRWRLHTKIAGSVLNLYWATNLEMNNKSATLPIHRPFNWKTTISFLSLATLLILVIGWLTISGILPIEMAIDYSNSQFHFIQVWLVIAIFIGILLPGTAFLLWFRYPAPRKVLGFYLLVLILQIVTEQVLSGVLFPSIVVTIGTIYTAFRLWQLWQGQKLLATNTQTVVPYRKLLEVLLWLILLFWLSNLIMLLVLPWPIIL